MLKRINGKEDDSGARVNICEANFPAPFKSGLEYGSPARGAWNIVHTAMLVPDGHQIYICAAGCLRGVVLTAAEMKAEHRFSSISVRENNFIKGDMEELIINGVSDVIERLPVRPPAVLVYTSCVHHFIGCDLGLVYRQLRERYPDIDFARCYMDPTMRKRGLNPDEETRVSIFQLLKSRSFEKHHINIVGNDLSIDESSELHKMLRAANCKVSDLTLCKTYEEFQKMASAELNIVTYPPARAAAKDLKKRLGQEWLYLPLSYKYAEIESNMKKLAEALNIEAPSYPNEIEKCESALRRAAELLGDTPIAIDYSATPRPVGLARLLSEYGMRVERIYLDAFNGEEKEDFKWLRENCPHIDIYATVNVKMRFLERSTDRKIVAIGQKAAYFTGTEYFVNMIEGGGMYGFDGICKLAEMIEDAYMNTKDVRNIIQIKGWGCGVCS